MSIQIRDSITPGIARAARGIKDRKPILEAMGAQLVSITKRSFSDATLRAAVWVARKKNNGRNAKGQFSHSLLRKSGALWQSIRITGVTESTVTAGSDRVYAAIQQFGGRGIPPRPFFPFTSSASPMTPEAQKKIKAVAMAKIEKILHAAEGTK